MGHELIYSPHVRAEFEAITNKYKTFLPELFWRAYSADFVVTHDIPFNASVIKNGKKILQLNSMHPYEHESDRGISQSFGSDYFSWDADSKKQVESMSEGLRDMEISHIKAWLPPSKEFYNGRAILIPFPDSRSKIMRALALIWEVPDFASFAPDRHLETIMQFREKYPTENTDIMRTWRLVAASSDVMETLFSAPGLFNQAELTRKIYSAPII